MNADLQSRVSSTVSRAAQVAAAEGEHRFADVIDLFLQGLTVPEAKEIAADSGIRFAASVRRAEVISVVREIFIGA